MFGNLVIGYLFLGGSGAGMVFVLSLLDLWPSARKGALSRSFFSCCYVFAAVVLGLGVLCLIADIGHPERFYYVIVFPTASMLTFGAYVLVLTFLCAAFLGFVALFNLSRLSLALVRTIEIISIVLSVFTMVYTALFLMEIDFVPLWNNAFLPVLFTLSSLCAGTAFIFIVMGGKCPLLLLRFDKFLILGEVVCVILFLLLAYGTSESSLAVIDFLTRDNAGLFWVGFVVCGLILPLILDVLYTMRRNDNMLLFAASFVLIGSYLLRYCVVNVSIF